MYGLSEGVEGMVELTTSTPTTTRPYPRTLRYPRTGHTTSDMGIHARKERKAHRSRLWKAPAEMIRVRARVGRESVSPAGKATNAEGRITVIPKPAELSGIESLRSRALAPTTRTMQEEGAHSCGDRVPGLVNDLRCEQRDKEDGKMV